MNCDNLRLFLEYSGERENELPKYMQNFIYMNRFLKENMHDSHKFLKDVI